MDKTLISIKKSTLLELKMYVARIREAVGDSAIVGLDLNKDVAALSALVENLENVRHDDDKGAAKDEDWLNTEEAKKLKESFDGLSEAVSKLGLGFIHTGDMRMKEFVEALLEKGAFDGRE